MAFLEPKLNSVYEDGSYIILALDEDGDCFIEVYDGDDERTINCTVNTEALTEALEAIKKLA